MSGRKGKSGGKRKGSGRPARDSGKVRVMFNLTPHAIDTLRLIPSGKRSKWVDGLIRDARRLHDHLFLE